MTELAPIKPIESIGLLASGGGFRGVSPSRASYCAASSVVPQMPDKKRRAPAPGVFFGQFGPLPQAVREQRAGPDWSRPAREMRKSVQKDTVRCCLLWQNSSRYGVRG